MGTKTFFFALVLASIAASAQNTPHWELVGGYQYTRYDAVNAQNQVNLLTQASGLPAINIGRHLNLQGWNTSLQENTNSWFGGIIDFSGNYGREDVAVVKVQGLQDKFLMKFRLYTFLAGPQFTLRKSSRLQPFVRVLLGGAHSSVQTTQLLNGSTVGTAGKRTDLGFAYGGGAGIDLHLLPQIALRGAADYIAAPQTTNSLNNLRVSGGIVFRVGSK